MPAWVEPALQADDSDALAAALGWCRNNGFDVVEILQERYAARMAATRAAWAALPAHAQVRVAAQWGGSDAA